ncbi:MAG: hypothetical protein QW273_00450 [Candidatus Pacearchaeota archaeon]
MKKRIFSLNKKSQISLFIIIGLFMFVIVLILIFFHDKLFSFQKVSTSSLSKEISSCIDDFLKNFEREFFEKKEFNNLFNVYYVYKGEKIPFVCYSTQYYLPCVQQSPLFSEVIRRRIENKISQELSQCVLKLKEDYEKKGYTFDFSSFNLSFNFQEKSFFYNVEIPIFIRRGDTSFKLKTVSNSVPSYLPNLLKTAETIVNYETAFCEFDEVFWQRLNREIHIEKFRGGDQTKVYILSPIHTNNQNEKIKMAIRTCILPAGI